VKEVNTPNNFGEKGYLGFEHVTLVGHPSTLDEADAMILRYSALYRRRLSKLTCSQVKNGYG
jgi:hypothetical protein